MCIRDSAPRGGGGREAGLPAGRFEPEGGPLPAPPLPVSYTHLDVYKRQIMCSEGNPFFNDVLAGFDHAEAELRQYNATVMRRTMLGHHELCIRDRSCGEVRRPAPRGR